MHRLESRPKGEEPVSRETEAIGTRPRSFTPFVTNKGKEGPAYQIKGYIFVEDLVVSYRWLSSRFSLLQDLIIALHLFASIRRFRTELIPSHLPVSGIW